MALELRQGNMMFHLSLSLSLSFIWSDIHNALVQERTTTGVTDKAGGRKLEETTQAMHVQSLDHMGQVGMHMLNTKSTYTVLLSFLHFFL